MQSGKTQKTLVRDLRKKCNRSTIYIYIYSSIMKTFN